MSGAHGEDRLWCEGQGSIQRPGQRPRDFSSKVLAKGHTAHSTALPSASSHPEGCQFRLGGFQTPLAPSLCSSHLPQSAPRPMPAGPAGQGPSVGVPLPPLRVPSAPPPLLPLYSLLMRGKRGEAEREIIYTHEHVEISLGSGPRATCAWLGIVGNSSLITIRAGAGLTG